VLAYVRSIRRESPRDLIVVFIPEYVVGRWWEQILHNQSALRLKSSLHFMPGVMVASVPWQLRSSVGREGRDDYTAPGDARRGTVLPSDGSSAGDAELPEPDPGPIASPTAGPSASPTKESSP